MVVAWSADHQHEPRTLSHDRQVRNPAYNQNIFHPHSKPLPPHTLFETRLVCPTTNQCRGEIFFARIATSHIAYLFATRLVCPTTNQCRGEIFFARIANHKHLAPCSQPDPSAPTTTNVGAKHFFARIANHYHLAPCSQPDPSAPTSSANVRAKNISPLQHTTDPPYPGYDPTIVPNTAGHRRRAMCWCCVAALAATHLPC